jgi:hypothetical protein
MKYLVISIILLILILSNGILQAQWTQSNGVNNKKINCLISNGANVLAGTEFGVYLSTNSGTNWTAVNNGLTDTLVSALAVNGNNIYAGTWGGAGIFLSTNNGTNWSQLKDGLLSTNYVYSLAVMGQNLFTGTAGGLFTLPLNVSTWKPVNDILTNAVLSLASIGTNLFAGTSYGGMYISTNYGTSWTQINDGLTSTYVLSLAVKGTDLFSGTSTGGVFLSTNNGSNWIQKNNGLTNSAVNSLAVNGNNIYAGTDAGVYLSTDNGSNWIQKNNGLIDTLVTALAFNGTDIFIGTSKSGVWHRSLSDITSISEKVTYSPACFTLSQNYPNPFNPGTQISYSLPSASNVKLSVFNTMGQTVKVLENGYKNAGNYSVNFNASSLPSGIYFYKLDACQSTQTKKMMLLK